MIMIIIINHFLLRLTRTLRGTKSASLLMLISCVTYNPRLGYTLAFIKKEMNPPVGTKRQNRTLG